MDELSNFYKDFAYGQNKFEFIASFLQDLYELIYGLMDQSINNSIIPGVGVYDYIPCQIFPTETAYYDVNELLLDTDMLAYYQSIHGVNLSAMPINARISYWHNTMTAKEKVELLDYKSKYIYLTTQKTGSPDKKNYDVVSFNLLTVNGKELIRNVDYAFENNKVYLLRNLPAYANNIKLIAENIAIDYNLPERMIGNRVRTSYTPSLTKNEYRDIVQTLLYVGLGGPTISNLNQTLNLLLGDAQFKVVDYPSATEQYIGYWSIETLKEKALGRFDFLILAPPDIVADANILKVVKDYLRLIKLAYTNFVITPYIEKVDYLQLRLLPHTINHSLVTKFTDRVTPIEMLQSISVSRTIKENLSIKSEAVSRSLAKQIEDNIEATETKITSISLSIANVSDKVTPQETKDIVAETTFSDRLIPLTNVTLYDSGSSYDNGVNFDSSGETILGGGHSYFDTVDIVMIPHYRKLDATIEIASTSVTATNIDII